ncbi:MAG: ATP-dependent helicase, partial [Desulfobacterales bacterium]|nr:ATP-dependent helicase [Desulfobacterales bacterium]
REESSKLEYHLHSTVSAEAEFIARKIDALVGGIRQLSIFEQTGNAETHGIDLGFRNIAVLYRLSDQAQEIARALDKAGIPYQLIGARPFFMTKELKPFYHWIRFTGANERDDFLQFLNYLPGAGKSTIQQLETTLSGQDEFRLQELSTNLFSAKIEGVLQDLKSSFLEFQKKTENSGIAEAVRGMMVFLKKDPMSGDSVRFLELCGIFGKNLPALSEHLYQNAQATIYDDRAEAIPLMTLHAAKGLEFPVVFIAGLEEQILPCDLPGLPGDPEEERRLFYVGLTRAQNKLFLTAAKNRTIFGKSCDQQESRFLKEIPKEILIRHYPQKPQPEISAGEQLSF